MVSCTQHLACQVGAEALRSGANALEAAIAVQLALAVVEPQHVSLLGGGGLMYLKSRGDTPLFLDFREEAPASYHPRTFCKGSCWLAGDPACDCSEGADTYEERCSGGHATGDKHLFTFGLPTLSVTDPRPSRQVSLECLQ